MKTDFSCGIVPVIFDGRFHRYLLVKHDAGHWAFPKGHPEDGETHLQTARRELAEETGLDRIEVLEAPTFQESYAFTKRSGRRVQKQVEYFLARVEPPADVVLQASEVSDHAWGTAAQTARRMTFPQGRALLRGVDAFIAADSAAAIGL